MKKIGIYSGTFDPIHEGHVAFAEEAVSQCGLEKVFFLVEPRPRRKQGVKALEHRDEMVRLAIRDSSLLGSIQLGQQRFTAVDTLPVLKQRFAGAQLHMLMGDDMLMHFADWPHVEELVDELYFVIGIRNSTEDEVTRRIDILRRTRGMDIRYKLFHAKSPQFASSKIKLDIKMGRYPQGLRQEVYDYIKDNGLYASSNPGS